MKSRAHLFVATCVLMAIRQTSPLAGAEVLQLDTASSAPLTLGPGTPWTGVLSKGEYSGTITGNGNFSLSGTTSGKYAGAFSIVPGTSGPVVVTLGSANPPGQFTNLAASGADYSGVSKFQVGGYTLLTRPNALGGGGGTAAVPLEVLGGGTLSIQNSTALNAPVLIKAGATLDPGSGLSGIGTISREDSPISMTVFSPSALNGAQLTPSFLRPGDTVEIYAEMERLSEFAPGLHYKYSTNALSGTMRLDNSTLHLLRSWRQSSVDRAVLSIAAGGATITGESDRTHREVGPIIRASGPVRFSPLPGTLDASPNFTLTNTDNQFQSTITIDRSTVGFGGADTMGGATEIVLDRGVAVFNQPFRPPQSRVYGVPVRIVTNGTISTHMPGMVMADLTLTLDKVRTANAVLAVSGDVSNRLITINNLELSGDLTIVRPNDFSEPLRLAIGSITQVGTTPRSLTLTPKPRSTFTPFFANRLTGEVSATGEFLIRDHVVVDGTFTPSSSPVTVDASAILAGSGVIHRPVFITRGTLAPGNVQDATTLRPGTLTIQELVLSSTSILHWNLGAPGTTSNDLVNVLGDLKLDGALRITEEPNFGPGRYLLFTYGGTLADQRLDLPLNSTFKLTLDTATPGQVALVVAIPDPASLALLGGAAACLGLRRRRRGRLNQDSAALNVVA